MTEEQYSKNALDKFRQWHFWWLVVFSLFLIITFVYYLPAKFLNQLSGDNHMMEEMREEMHKENDMLMDDDDHMTGEQMMDEHGDDAGHGGYQYHEEVDAKNGPAVNLNISPVPYITNNLLKMDFFVRLKPDSIPISVSNLQIEHEKLMHVIGVRSDLNEFFHIHPDANSTDDGGVVFVSSHAFKNPGQYKIWSEIKKNDTIYIFGHPQINVMGQGSVDKKSVVSFGRNVIVGNYQVSLETDIPLLKNKENKLYFDIHDLFGNEISTENYLGAKMHLTIIKDDLKQIIHTHPEGGNNSHTLNFIKKAKAHGEVEDDHQAPSEDEVIQFGVNFAEPGLYKAFAQFRPAGSDLPEEEPLLAEFWLQVEEKAPAVISVWWWLLTVSAVLILVLSFAISKYLNIKGQ